MRYSTISILSIFFLIGCKNNSTPVGSVLTGDISGSVILYNDAGTLLQDQSGVQVLFKSTSASESTLSLADGTWLIKDLSAGIYEYELSKPGFFSTQGYSFQFVGGGTYYFGQFFLSAIPTTSVSRLTVSKVDSTKSLLIQGTMSSADSLGRNIAILIAKTPISDLNHIQYLFSATAPLTPNSVNFTITVSLDHNQTGYNIQTGTPLYLVAFPRSRVYMPEQFNPITKMYEFESSGVTLSNIVTLTAP